ncbi:MAG: hypothetical protein U0229_11185 [Anaeromyxobacter sp.]
MTELQAFIGELRRRRVFRALVAWGVVAFAVLQVTEPIMHALDLPDWTLKAVVAVLAAGFPVTSLLAWAYDLRTTGVERTAPLDPAAPPAGPRRVARWAVLVGLGLAVAAPGVLLVLWRARAPVELPPGQRILVAVADFENDTGEPELDALSGLLITSLEQSRRLEVLTRSRMFDILRQMGHASIPRIDEPLGREVGRKASVRALVLAAVHRFDTLYTVEMKALDPSTSDYLFTLKEDGKGKSSIPAMIDRLSERTRERLRERREEVQSSRLEVAKAITPNLEAYRLYFDGKTLSYGRADYAGALRKHQQAVALDPDFALAWYEIAYLGVWADLPEGDRRAALAAALRNVDRVPQKERELMLAWKAHQDGRDDEAVAIYTRAVHAFPRDKDLQFYAGDLPFHAFLSPRGSARDLEDVLPYFEAASALDPSDGETQWHRTSCLVSLGRTADAIAAARAWVAATPSARAHSSLAAALLAARQEEEAFLEYRRAIDAGLAYFPWQYTGALARQGRFDEARRQLEAADAKVKADFSWLTSAVELALYEGRYREALSLADGLPDAGALEVRANQRARVRAIVLAERGAGDRAWEALRPAVEAGGAVDFAPVFLALAGEPAHAAEAARLLAAGSRQLSFFDAVAAWRAGRLDDGAARLEALTRAKYAPDRVLASALLGRLEAERGRDVAAVEALERHRAVAYAPVLGGDATLFPRTLFLLARTYERLGERDRARERADQLLTLWARADADLPLLREAKALRARL